MNATRATVTDEWTTVDVIVDNATDEAHAIAEAFSASALGAYTDATALQSRLSGRWHVELTYVRVRGAKAVTS